jgi:hypothetical protein
MFRKSSVQSDMSMSRYFRYVIVFRCFGGFETLILVISGKWSPDGFPFLSQRFGSWTSGVSNKIKQFSLVITTSSICPQTCVALRMCCTSSCSVNVSRNVLASHLLGLSRWKFKSPVITISSLLTVIWSRNSDHSAKNVEVLILLDLDGGGR